MPTIYCGYFFYIDFFYNIWYIDVKGRAGQVRSRKEAQAPAQGMKLSLYYLRR